MKLSDLELFLSVAKHENMTVAAGELNKEPHDLSKRMSALKDYFGTAVVERSSNGGVMLTEAGTRMLPYAAEVASLLAEMRAQSRSPQRARIGVNESAAMWLSDWLKELRNKHPELAIELKVGTTNELGALVLQGALDFAIGTRPFTGNRLTQEIIASLKMVFVGSAELHREKEYSIEQLAAYGLIGFQADSTPTEDLLETLHAACVKQCRVDAVSSIAVMVSMVENGCGVATLPEKLANKLRQRDTRLKILHCCNASLERLPLWLSWQSRFDGSERPAALVSLQEYLAREHP